MTQIEENVSDNETVFSVHVSPGVVLSFLCIFLQYMLADHLPQAATLFNDHISREFSGFWNLRTFQL